RTTQSRVRRSFDIIDTPGRDHGGGSPPPPYGRPRSPTLLLCSVPTSSSQPAGVPTLLGAQQSLVASALVRRWIVRIGPALGLIAIILVFSLLTNEPGRYLSAVHLRIVLSQTVITAIGAIGMTMIIVSGGIDLSVGATIALTGVITALGIGAGWSPSLALLAAIATGGVIGLINRAIIKTPRVCP